MTRISLHIIYFFFGIVLFSCNDSDKKNKGKILPVKKEKNVTAKDILGNPEYLAISYGGYREVTRDSQPTIKQLKNDLKILSVMGIKVLRT